MQALDAFDIDDLSLEPAVEAEGFARLRRESPVHRDPRRDAWWLTRHADVLDVSRRPELYSSEPKGPWHPFESRFSMQAQDGPLHHALRNIVSRGFTPRRVRELEQRARSYADAAIDALAARGHGDLVQDVAVPVPMRIIADMLGLEGADLELFRAWNDAIESMTSGAGTAQVSELATCERFALRVAEVVEERRKRPRKDLISAMLAGRVELLEPFRRDAFPGVVAGDGVMGFIAFLVLAGSDTTRHAIAGGMRALIEHPEQRARLRRSPELLPSAVEELLRWVTPVRAMRRTLTRDVELCGSKLRAGESVVLLYSSANRDELVFEAPQSFRIDRQPNPHLAFGSGTHFCLGANLARMEISVVIGRLLDRLPELELAPGARPLRAPSPILNGLVRLPVVTGAPRESAHA